MFFPPAAGVFLPSGQAHRDFTQPFPQLPGVRAHSGLEIRLRPRLAGIWVLFLSVTAQGALLSLSRSICTRTHQSIPRGGIAWLMDMSSVDCGHLCRSDLQRAAPGYEHVLPRSLEALVIRV